MAAQASPQERFTGVREVLPRHRFAEARLTEYLAAHLPGFAGPLTVREFKGGQSNPTYRLETPRHNYVLRRKPPGVLLPSAHAVEREFKIISALNAQNFPVPRAHLLCEDAQVIGTAFYVMEHVPGRVLWDPLLPGFAPAERRAIYSSLYEIMARLHSYDPRQIGLESFGRPGNYFARQIARWAKQYRASQTETIPEMDALMEWLPANIPPDEAACLVHGDYKLDNVIVHPAQPRVVAVLDWEISTVGHPLGDLTYALSQRLMPAAGGAGFTQYDDAGLRALGIPTQAEIISRYCAQTGRAEIAQLDFYFAYNLFRSACILQGIVGRVRAGTAANPHATGLGNARALAKAAWRFAQKLGA